jgi:hypothetical protein
VDVEDAVQPRYLKDAPHAVGKARKAKAKPPTLRSIKPAPRALEIINPEEPKP